MGDTWGVVKIESVDDFLLTVMEGCPEEKRQYELHVHPDVYQALHGASLQTLDWPTRPAGSSGRYGSAEVVIVATLQSGAWELYEEGELLNSGRLGAGALPHHG